MPRKTKRTIIEEEMPQHDPAPVLEDDPDTETLEYALRQFDDRNGLELKYYLAQPGGSAFIGAFPDIVTESQLQEWYPQGGKFEIRIYIHGEFQDRKFRLIAPRPGGIVNGNGHSGSDPLLRELLMEVRTMRQAPQSSVGELAQALKALHEIQPAQSNNLGFLEAIKLGIQLSGGKVPDDDDSFGGVVKSVLKESGPAIIQGLMAARAPGPPPGSNPVQLQAAPPENAMNVLLKSGINFLKKKAMAGADPELYIAFALDNCEDERFAPILHAILTQEFSVFASIDAEIGQPPYEPFFRTLYDGIRSELIKTNPVATSPDGEAGNVRHLTDNAQPRKARSK